LKNPLNAKPTATVQRRNGKRGNQLSFNYINFKIRKTPSHFHPKIAIFALIFPPFFHQIWGKNMSYFYRVGITNPDKRSVEFFA